MFLEKNSLKITFKHNLSEMYLLREKAQPLSFHYAKQQPSFPLICRVIEERRSWYLSKNMITLSTVHNPKRIPLAQFMYTKHGNV